MVATAAAHLLVRTLATWAQLSSSSTVLAMAEVAVVVVDAVGLLGVIILLEHVGDSGVDG